MSTRILRLAGREKRVAYCRVLGRADGVEINDNLDGASFRLPPDR